MSFEHCMQYYLPANRSKENLKRAMDGLREIVCNFPICLNFSAIWGRMSNTFRGPGMSSADLGRREIGDFHAAGAFGDGQARTRPNLRIHC